MATQPTQQDSAPSALEAAAANPAERAAGGRPSFREIYDAQFAFVWRYAANRRVPAAAIDDVVQEVFVVVHNRLGSYEGRSSLRTWIAGIAYNVVRAYLRKPAHRRLGDSLDNDELLRSDDCSPAEHLERKAAVSLLDQVLDEMSEVQREVFILHEIEQISCVELSEVLGVNENTLRARLMAARKVFSAAVARQKASEGRRVHGR